jgi:hypothetical protein
MMPYVFATSSLLELYKWYAMPPLGASDSEIISHTMRHVAEASAEFLHWQIIVTYWNTSIQQNNIWSIAFEALIKEI